MMRPTRTAALVLTAGVAYSSALATITVDNLEGGELLRHPVAILRGKSDDSEVMVGADPKSATKFPVVEGRYVALVELKPGKNMVMLSAGRDTTRIRLDYRPMTTPYKVRAVYLVGQDEEPRYDSPTPGDRQLYKEKFDTALKILQAFTAEAMDQAGYGPKTFPLEFDNQGKVIIHVLKHPLTGDALRSMTGNDLWSLFYRWLEPQFSFDTNKVCALLGFSRYDAWNATAKGHTALGGGGLGIFGSASMYTWPSSLQEVPAAFANPKSIDAGAAFDDSANRGTYWASASTTIGAMLHEMGHTFGLPHSTDWRDIMSRGFDLLNRSFTVLEPPKRGTAEATRFTTDQTAHFSPFFAARLNWHPWFQPDAKRGERFATSLVPSISVDSATDEVIVRAPYGARVVGAERDGKTPWFEVHSANAPTLLKFARKDLREKIDSPEGVSIYVIDSEGNEARLDDKR